MTGAPLPARRRRGGHGRAHARCSTIAAWTSRIGRRSPDRTSCTRPGDAPRRNGAVAAGSVLRPQEFGVLATVGRTSVQCRSGAARRRPCPPAMSWWSRNSDRGRARFATATARCCSLRSPGRRRAALSRHCPRYARQLAVADSRRITGRRAVAVRRRLGGQARSGARRAAGGGRRRPFSQGRDEAGQTRLLRHTAALLGVAGDAWFSDCRAIPSVRSCVSSCSCGRRCESCAARPMPDRVSSPRFSLRIIRTARIGRPIIPRSSP